MELKIATIFKTETHYKIGSNSFSKNGIAHISAPYFQISINDSSEEVIASIKLALEANKMAEYSKEQTNELGFVSEKERNKALECIVELVDDILYFNPTKRVRGGSDIIGEKTKRIEKNSSNAEIFNSLMSAFDECI